jgi:rubrerythrin
MSIIDTAISLEKEGEAFYWEIADKTDNRGIKNICLMLARDEAEHIRTFEKLRSGEVAGRKASTIIEDAKKIFRRFVDDIFDPDEALAPEALFEKAMGLEKKTLDFYSECALAAENPAEKDIFLALADEEKKHYGILNNIIEFRRNSREWIRKQSFENTDK